MPGFFFFFLFFSFSFPQGWLKNGRQGGVLLRPDKGAKKRPGISWSAMNYTIPPFFPLDLNHISIELNNNTTRTQMYLLSVVVYYDPLFFYNLAKPPSLLLLLSRSSAPLMCSLRGPSGPARGSRWHLQRSKPLPIGQETFYQFKKSYPESSYF